MHICQSIVILAGSDGVLRLYTKTNAENVPCVYYSFDTKPAHPLYCMEQKLFTRVRFSLNAGI